MSLYRHHHLWSRHAMIGVALLGGCVVPTVEPPPVETCEPVPFGCVSVAWTGDTLLADAALPALTENGYGHPFEYIGGLLDQDLAIGNAEGPITTLDAPYNEGQTWSYNALPEAAAALAEAGFDAMSIANNHLFDRGPDGLRDTQAHLEEVGVMPFGGGVDRAEALVPYMFETAIGTVAVFGFGRSSSWVPAAGAGPGQLLLSTPNAALAQEVAVEVDAAYTVAYVHWGQNYSAVTDGQRDQARALVDAGFDLIVGHGPHNQQGVEIVDGVPVLWSLGNFAFGTPGRWDDDFPGFGLVAHSVFGEEGLTEIALHCIVTDNGVVAYQPVPCNETEATDVLGALGAVSVQDGVARVLLD